MLPLLYFDFFSQFTGQAAFLPKYLESQFNLTASFAAMLVGAVVVPAGAAGTLLGKVFSYYNSKAWVKKN